MVKWTRIIQSKLSEEQVRQNEEDKQDKLSKFFTNIYWNIFDNYRPQNFDTVNEFLNTISNSSVGLGEAHGIMNEYNINEDYEQDINDFVDDIFEALKKSYNTYRLHMNNQEEVEENGEEWNDDWSLRDAEFPEEDENFENNYNNIVKKYKKKLSQIFKKR